MSAIYKLRADQSMYLRGFDRRGAAAALHNASASGFTASGHWADQADFAVLVLFDIDDAYGHLFTSRYLPDPSLTGVTLDFDLALANCQSPVSPKYQSVPWGALSYTTSAGAAGTVQLAPHITSTTGAVSAGATYTVNGFIVPGDRVQLIYLSNVVWDYTVVSGDTAASVAAALTAQINATNWSAVDTSVTLKATQSGAAFTVTASAGRDGNSVQLQELHKSATTYLTPAGASKLTGGADPASLHIHLDFTALGIDSLRQAWLTFAPAINYDSGSVNPALVPYAASDWSAVFSNWTVADPNGVTPLKMAGAGSVTVDSRDAWASYSGSGWSEQAGFYYLGFARASAHAGDTVTVTFTSQFTHNLYLGSALDSSGGIFHVSLDGVAQPDLDTYLPVSTPTVTRRLLKSSVAAGSHTVVLTVSASHNSASSGYSCWFDYLQAAVPSDPASPGETYSSASCACDFDTGQTYQLAPARALWILNQAGFQGDIDFYAGVFFALKRVRSGGSLHQATITLSGSFTPGTGFGNGDAVFLQIGGSSYGDGLGTAFGVAVYPADTLATLAQRFVNAINTLFVGVCAAPGATAGVFTITTLSPINGFTLFDSFTPQSGSTGSIAISGDIKAGNEGVWEVDATQTSPLNSAFTAYFADFCAIAQSNGQTVTVAFSQELLAPPDENTSAGAWSQRFADGVSVLTDTEFGGWGAGFVEAIAIVSGVATVQQTGHGYITGNTAHFASTSGSGEWAVTVTDANHYTFVVADAITNSGGYTPGVGDSVFIDLQTSQCAFNPSTVTPYAANCYAQAASIMNAAGLTPWLQFGEILHWFYSKAMSLAIEGFNNQSGAVEVQTASAHGFASGQTVILAGTGFCDGTQAITVVDATHFTIAAAWPGGSPAAAGTVSGGGMAYYDANQTAAAETALARALAGFYTQDDDPTVNGSADANFLASRIKSHIDAIRAAVLASYPAAKFELLWPYDVNYESSYYTAALPYPQGGRLNRAVNLPAAYLTQAGSGLDRLKMEGLSWGATYRNLTLAQAAIQFPTAVGTWPVADARYLVAWFNGGCAWPQEYLLCLNAGVVPAFWAVDHLTLFGWPLPPLPVNARQVFTQAE